MAGDEQADEEATPVEIICPDLGLGSTLLTLSLWLVEVGQEVTEGDRVVELLAGGITVDLPAPATGILSETRVIEDEPVTPGMVLGLLMPLAESAE